MLHRAALLTLLGAVAACDPRPQVVAPVRPPAPEPPAVVLSQEQIHERSEQCGRKSREGFRREWKDGTAKTAKGQVTADFTHHYNAKLDTCFYLLTVVRQENGSGHTLSKTLLDINEGETYGEYAGPETDESPPRRFPDTCRVVDIYCASEREWGVLVGSFMEENRGQTTFSSQ